MIVPQSFLQACMNMKSIVFFDISKCARKDFHLFNNPVKCPGTFYPGDFPGEKIAAKSVPGQAVNLPD